MKLRADANQSEVLKKLLTIRDTYYVKYLREDSNQLADNEKLFRGFELQFIGDIHLYSSGINDRYDHGDIKIVWMFGFVAILILSLACINFINLSTAKSTNRAKEVGLRKVVGSVKGNLISQFLTESVLFSFYVLLPGVHACMATSAILQRVGQQEP